MRAVALLLLAAAPGIAAASHPLLTEDTGTLGAGTWQLEVHGERVREGDERSSETALVVSHGIAEAADFQVEVPEGREPVALSVKWRFLERGPLRLAAKPDVYDDGKWGLNGVAGYAIGRFELLAHAGYLRNRPHLGERRSLTHASAAALYAATRRLKLALDLARDTNPDRESRTALRTVVYGLLYSPSEHVDIGLGLQRGRSDPADDRALLAGIKLRF